MQQQLSTAFARITLMSAVLASALSLQAQQYKMQNDFGKEGYYVERKDEKGLAVRVSASGFTMEDKEINGVMLKHLAYPGMLLQNEAGYPDLPANARMVALPQGAKAVLKSVTSDKQTFQNIDMAPAPVIPVVSDDSPLKYDKDPAVYTKDAFYPEAPVSFLKTGKIRGVDVVMLGVSPFQYNPVTKELIVHNNLEIEIGFEGGNGQFGDNAYRSRYWEPILEDMVLNYDQLTPFENISYNKGGMGILADTGCEYAIVIPSDPAFAQWADSIKKFRTEQGIFTRIFTLNAIGGTTSSAIKTWVDNAYNTWTIKPAAILMLGDYGTNGTTSLDAHKYTHMGGFPDFASDNYYADVDGDDLPDIAFSRIVANNATQLQTMCTKFLNYERNPPTDPAFYSKPLVAMGWQDDRWFQVCASVVTGYLDGGLGKTTTRAFDLGSPASNTGNGVPNTGTWSTNSNTTTVLNYFGPSGLNYIPAQPGSFGTFSGATATTVNNAINAGTFLVLHRDHGYYTGWGDPSYTTTSINSLTNVNNKLPFVFSINCQTGAYHHTSECFVEKMHRYTKNGQNSGALGMIGDAETSYSFVNDVMVWGMFDNMWPAFMPANTTNPSWTTRDKRPAFANVAAKYYLSASSWTGTSTKQITYQLYHMFGDAFQWFYTVVPQNLTVVHNSTIPAGATSFAVSADAGSFIAITMSTPTGPVILGTAAGTGSSINIPLSQSPTTNILVTVTKQDYLRYSSVVSFSPTGMADVAAGSQSLVCYPNPFSNETSITYSLEQAGNVSLTVYDMIGQEVKSILKDESQSAGPHVIKFTRENLAKGTYSCILRTDSGIVTRNFVIE